MFCKKKIKPVVRVVSILPCEFDIEGMDVFSIERNYDDQMTIIGYLDKARDIKTWHLPCLESEHCGFVKRLRIHLGLEIDPQ